MFYKYRTFQLWARRLHIYVSMAVLGLMLFFAVTGITLNRPELFVAAQAKTSEWRVTIPHHLLFVESKVAINEPELRQFLAQHTPIRGQMSRLDIYLDSDNGVLQEGEASASFTAPGYSAALFIDLVSREAELDISDYGWVAKFNDLHKGRHSGEWWKWVIDVSSLLMLVFILSGLALLLPKKSTLRYAIRWCSFGTLITFVIYWLAVP